MKIAMIGSRSLDGYRKKMIDNLLDKKLDLVTINIGNTNKYIISVCKKRAIRIEIIEIKTIGEANMELAKKADVLIVLSGGEKSGTILVAKNFLDLGKDVFALPGRIDDELSYAPNFLIKNGAGVILKKCDILGNNA